MKAILKAFGLAFGIGGLGGVALFFAAGSVPDAYGWLIAVCLLALLWTPCIVAAATGRPLSVQTAVAVGVPWGLMGGSAAAVVISGQSASLDWPGFFQFSIGLPLAILATVSVKRVWRWTWRRLHPDSGPKRLPVLWIICVLMGLGGMNVLTLALSRETLGMVVFGALALLSLVIAAALYLRRRWGWYLAVASYGLGIVAVLLFQVLGGHPGALAIAICTVPALATILYLWLRRRQFGADAAQQVRLLSAPGICALAIVSVLGGGYLLLMTVDDPAESFPALQAKLPLPPDKDNGYVTMQQMLKRWPSLWDDERKFEDLEDSDDALGEPGRGRMPSAEWLAKARPLVSKYATLLADLPALLSKPHFVEVTRLHGFAWVGRDMPWLAFGRNMARLLAQSSYIQAAEGHWKEAAAEADKAIALGVLMSKESTSTIQILVGDAVCRIGLDDLLTVAAHTPDESLLRVHLRSLLPEEVLRRGSNRGMAGDFRGDVGLFEELRRMGTKKLKSSLGAGGGTASLAPFSGWDVRSNPLLKMNMTANLFGRYMQHRLVRPGAYVPAPEPPYPLGPVSKVGVVRHVLGYIELLRDPMGYYVAAMMLPAEWRYQASYYQTVADSHLVTTYLALRCYRLDHGRLPEGLDALVPQYLKAVPRDPFNGKPLGYKPAGEQPRIWSVGQDGVTNPLRGGPYPMYTYTTFGGDDTIIFLRFPKNAGGKATAARSSPTAPAAKKTGRSVSE